MQATPPFRFFVLARVSSRLTQTQVYHRGRTKKKKEKGNKRKSFLFSSSAEQKTNESAHAHSTP